MKKFLAMLLVLGMVSTASAGLQISVNGDPNPPDSEIVIGVSDTLILDIWTDADIAFFGGDTWAILANIELATIDGGDPIAIDGLTNVVNGKASANDGVVQPQGMDGIWGLATNLSPTLTVPAGTVLVDGIRFHCEAPGDTIIQLYHVDENQPLTGLLDQVVIHQTPEPMTLGLLGLGGLGLLRRRRS